MKCARGLHNGKAQSFIYRGIQITPTLDDGWICMLDNRMMAEDTEDNICIAIDVWHVAIDARQARERENRKVVA